MNLMRVVALLCLMYASGVAATIAGWHDSSNFASSPSESYGWVCDSSDYSKPLKVDFYENGVIIGSAVANVQAESAVQNVCGGHAFHRFVWPYPDGIRDGNSHAIYAYANNVDATSRSLISGSPVTATMQPVGGLPKGWFDYISPEYAWGWACDPSYVSSENAGMSVDFYREDGLYLGSAVPNIRREVAVGSLCGGQRNRAFQFIFPQGALASGTHTIFAYIENVDGSGRMLLGGKGVAASFLSQSQATIASSPSVTSGQTDAVIGTTTEGFQNGAFAINTYCYGDAADNVSIGWDAVGLTGLTTGASYGERALWQRGVIDLYREIVVQAKGFNYGAFIKTGGVGYDAACSGIAGTGPGWSWHPFFSPLPPVLWSSGTQDELAKEVSVSFGLSVKSASGVAYVHPALFFRDIRNNQRIWLTIQAFDTRPNQQREFVSSDGGSPIVVTSFGNSGSFGRTISGALSSAAPQSVGAYEFRLNGFQFENVLDVAGCSNSDPTKLSCDAESYQMTIGFIEIETATSGSEIGATISNISVKRTVLGVLH